jgi:hypothetical protein
VVSRAVTRLLALLFVLVAAPAAPGGVIELYGEENVGTAGAQFLRIPVGARGVALGQAFTACATDGSALFWNPAGILRSPGRRNLFLSHTEYTAGIDLSYLGYHWRGQNFGYGLSAGILRSGEIDRTDEFHQEGTGETFRADQYFLGLTLARAMTDRFSIGGTLKFYQENLDEFYVRSLLADLGILYFVGAGDLRVGFAVRNFGPDLETGGGNPPPAGGGIPLPGGVGYVEPSAFQSFPAPTVGSFGVAYTFALDEGLALLTTADFNHPSDFSESFRTGAELGLQETLFVRLGYETNRDEGGFAAGFGLHLGRERLLLRLDYAYSDLGAFGTIHHFSLDVAPLLQRKKVIP